MPKITFELDDKRDKEFRRKIADVKGLHRGAIQESLEEAIDLWIESEARKLVESEKNE